MAIQVEIKNSLADKLAKLAGLDLSPAYKEIGEELVSMVRFGFRLSQNPYGDKWEPLKIREGKPLQDTGNLQQSFHADAGGDSVVIGTNVPYAATHQYGAVIVPKNKKMLAWKVGEAWHFAKRVNIPARPMLPDEGGGLPKTWGEIVAEILLENISEEIDA